MERKAKYFGLLAGWIVLLGESALAQPCYKMVEKNCPSREPELCAELDDCPFVPNGVNCSHVVNGILQGTYSCPDWMIEVRIIFMSATPDCTTEDDDGTYESRTSSVTTECVEFRPCDAECTATTEPKSTGTFSGPGGNCSYTIVKAHCRADSEGEWQEWDNSGTNFTAIPCLSTGSSCPVEDVP